ncbi:MAG: hypothetical protein WAW88_09535 [Nocardioides sp.]
MRAANSTKSTAAVGLVLSFFLGGLALAGGDRTASSGRSAGLSPGASDRPSASAAASPSASTAEPVVPQTPAEPVIPEVAAVPELPGGGHKVFGNNRFLVAYYGSAHTSSLGVLGERSPAQTMPVLRRAARRFRLPGEQIQPVFELIVTVADGYAGKDGDYSHHIPTRYVKEYVAAAKRHGVLLVLDVQPGRSSFPQVVKHWEWALKEPWVGLALDPEWRMGRGLVPGRVIGSVDAAEINRTSAWLAALTRRERLPEKVFMLHQFRTDMIRRIGQVRPREGLAMVQHVDGFGPPGAKLGTFHTVARPRQFHLGFKLFYDEDQPRMSAAAVRAIRPKVRFVSFQ